MQLSSIIVVMLPSLRGFVAAGDTGKRRLALGRSMRYWIEDWLAPRLDHPRHVEPSAAAADIDFEIDCSEDRRVQFLCHRRQYLKKSCAWGRILTAEDAKECLALCGCGTLIDCHDALPVTLVKGAGKEEGRCGFQPVKLGVAVIAFVNNKTHYCLAVAVSWQCIELAGASIIAIAVGELAPLNHPLRVGHDTTH